MNISRGEKTIGCDVRKKAVIDAAFAPNEEANKIPVENKNVLTEQHIVLCSSWCFIDWSINWTF
eukprot:snap_masked-scaffold_1-processed-gene-12.17-mRNA-1 protein AED:1.00 eAED:1.00 QI:0/0/0/0/1/1/2/0/63